MQDSIIGHSRGHSSPRDDCPSLGFNFWLFNESGLEYHNAEITIGGLKDGIFVETESYPLPKILVPNSSQWPIDNSSKGQYICERWNPNLDLIRAIPSNKVYFSLKIGNNTAAIATIFKPSLP